MSLNFGMSQQTTTESAPRNITGGTVTTSGSYTIHTFTSNGTFWVGSLGSTTQFEILMVGGGAGGPGAWKDIDSGGIYRYLGYGRGGGILSGITTSVSVGTFSIAIGGGGSRGISSSSVSGCYGNNGGNSTFSGFTAYGGYTYGRSTTSQNNQSPLTGWGMGGNKTSSISGSSVLYGADNSGGGTSSGGAGGAAGGANAGIAGGAGIVIIRYLT